MTFQAPSIDASAADKDIMYDCEHTLTSHPSAISILNLTVVEYRGFIQLHAPTVYCSSKRYLIRMEVFPARFSNHFLWRVAQNILDRSGGVQYPSVK